MSEKSEKDKEPIGLKVREEKIQEIADIDCNLVDARTRKVLIYLLSQEIKKLSGMPRAWTAKSVAELEGIKAGLEMCKRTQARQNK